MPEFDELIHKTASLEEKALKKVKPPKKTFWDYLALTITTLGVGYLPFAPGTFGSMVGVAIYILFGWIEISAVEKFVPTGWSEAQIAAWIHFFNLLIFLLFCLIGIWAANRATVLFKKKDPQQAVVDEVMGQLLVFLFIPFTFSWKLILAGFLLFRLFDIWKPYPIDSLQNLPAGIGVCADDILAGVYGGLCLTFIYAIGVM
jgi:phosphatidylglycerophosphatase A